MKKVGVLFIAIFLISLLFIIPLIIQAVSVYAQDDTPGIDDGSLPVVSEIEKGKEKFEKYMNETTWEYLSREWKNILLRNKFIAGLDSFLSSISIVFRILFGMPYSLSFKLLVIIVLWFWLLFNFRKLSNFLALSKWIGFLITLALSIIFAQVGILSWLSEKILWLIFVKKEWYWHLIFSVLIIVALLFVYYFSSKVGKAAKEAKKKAKEEEAEQKRKELKKFTEKFEQGAGI